MSELGSEKPDMSEFERLTDELKSPYSKFATQMGLERLNLMAARGFVLAATVAERPVAVFEIVPDSPVGRFTTALEADEELSREEKNRRLLRFMTDVQFDLDPDHFKAQWPELF